MKCQGCWHLQASQYTRKHFTSNDRTVKKYINHSRVNLCYQSDRALEIYIPGQVNMLNKTFKHLKSTSVAGKLFRICAECSVVKWCERSWLWNLLTVAVTVVSEMSTILCKCRRACNSLCGLHSVFDVCVPCMCLGNWCNVQLALYESYCELLLKYAAGAISCTAQAKSMLEQCLLSCCYVGHMLCMLCCQRLFMWSS